MVDRLKAFILGISILSVEACNRTIVFKTPDSEDPSPQPSTILLPKTLFEFAETETPQAVLQLSPYSSTHHTYEVRSPFARQLQVEHTLTEDGLQLKILWNRLLATMPAIRVSVRVTTGPHILDEKSFWMYVPRRADRRSHTLVIFNQNSPVSEELARAYQTKRNLDAAYLCGVKAPISSYMRFRQLLGVRNHIVRNCICPLIPSTARPSPCDATQLNSVSEVSPITHLALMKDLPHRLTNLHDELDYFENMPTSLGDEDPSADYFLSRLLYFEPQWPVQSSFDSATDSCKSGDRLFPDTPFWGVPATSQEQCHFENLFGPSPRQAVSAGPSTRTLRGIIPAFDKMVAYGRIDGLNLSDAISMIDRTIAAEAAGFSGRTLLQLLNGTHLGAEYVPEESVLYKMTCLHQGGTQNCKRVSVAHNWDVPGSVGSNLRQPTNIGLYLGGNVSWTHQAFDGFSNMLNWRKSSEPCVSLCQNLSTEQERQACRSQSNDFFGEINTQCVGASGNLLAYQLRSWTVLGYGVWPSGWGPSQGGNGQIERTFPTIETELDEGNELAFARFGSPLIQQSQESCFDALNQISPCESLTPVDLSQQVVLPSSLSSLDFPMQISFRFRTSVVFEKPTPFRILLHFYDSENSIQTIQSSIDLMTFTPHVWHSITLSNGVSFPATLKDVKRVILTFSANYSSGVRGTLDLTDIQIRHQSGQLSLKNGNFKSAPIGNTANGDWAANVISRLRGIGYWGSSSHFRSGGYSFSEVSKTAGALYSGLTLSESLLIQGHEAISGVIYADPLYRMGTVELRLDDPELASSRFISLNPTKRVPLLVTADLVSSDETTWFLEACANQSPCIPQSRWTPLISGTQAIKGAPLLEIDPQFLLGPNELPFGKTLHLRLRAYPKNQTTLERTDYLEIHRPEAPVAPFTPHVPQYPSQSAEAIVQIQK